MKTTWLPLAAAIAILAPAVAHAIDAPHDASFTTGDCTECHRMHGATGTGLTNQPVNADLCMSCHNAGGRSPRVQWQSAEQATLVAGKGASGKHHRWDAPTTNADAGALPPTNLALSLRTPGNLLQCSTCHDLHKAGAANTPASVHASIDPGTATAITGPTTGGGSGVLTLQALGATPRAAGYRVKVVSGPGIIISHDANVVGVPPTWLNWIGGVWATGADNGTGRPFTPGGSAVALDDPAVSVAISTGSLSGDYWDFYVAYPFVRTVNQAGEMCVDCHRDRNHTYAAVRGEVVPPGFGWAGGGRFSHPVGEALNANGGGYDRTAPLDANGALQGGAGVDANPTNDLQLVGGRVSCLTCHAPHEADSNSLTVDQR